MRPVFYQGAYGEAVTYEPELLPSLLHPIKWWRGLSALLDSRDEREAMNAWAKRRAAVDAAERRAELVLHDWMTPEQRRTWRSRGWFEVRSNKGNLWRIRQGSMGNVLEMGPFRHHAWCAAPVGVPPADEYLAQALMIMSDEAKFKSIANMM